MEVTIALALLLVVGAIAAQALVWSLRERQRAAMHYAALELAANVLEEASALPFDQLNQTWADARAIPSEMADVLPEGKLRVTVDRLKDATQAQRVTADVSWQSDVGMPRRNVTLTTVLSGRTKKGGQP